MMEGAGVVNIRGPNIFNGFLRAAFFRIFRVKTPCLAQDEAGNKSGAPILTIVELIPSGMATYCSP
jgi:hypothetical protein